MSGYATDGFAYAHPSAIGKETADTVSPASVSDIGKETAGGGFPGVCVGYR